MKRGYHMGVIAAALTFILPLIYIFCGILFVYRTPSYKKKGIAYRTRRACASEAAWQYANYSFGIVCLFMGIYIILLTAVIVAMLVRFGATPLESRVFCFVIIFIQAVLFLLPFHNTEAHLKIYFTEDGEDLSPGKKLIFRKRKNEKEWEPWDDWNKWPDDDHDDDWDDWDTWLRKRDMELDEQREAARRAAGSDGKEKKMEIPSSDQVTGQSAGPDRSSAGKEKK